MNEIVNEVNELIKDISKNHENILEYQKKGEYDEGELLTMKQVVLDLKSRWNDAEDKLMVEDFLINGPGRTRDINYEK